VLLDLVWIAMAVSVMVLMVRRSSDPDVDEAAEQGAGDVVP
jgi:hypothetical protein